MLEAGGLPVLCEELLNKLVVKHTLAIHLRHVRTYLVFGKLARGRLKDALLFGERG